MDQQFHNKRQSLMVTDNQAGLDKLTDEKKFTGRMFNIKLEEKSYKMSFKALPVKIQRSSPHPMADRVKFILRYICHFILMYIDTITLIL